MTAEPPKWNSIFISYFGISTFIYGPINRGDNMLKQSKKSLILLLAFLFIIMLPQSMSLEAKAETANTSIPQYINSYKETIGFFAQYENKTIINNTVLFDNNIKYSVYENGQKHVLSEDFDKIRWMRYMGIYNEGVYSICNKLPGMPIYRADLNTYSFEFVKNAPVYKNVNMQYDSFSVDNRGNFWISGTDSSINVLYDGITKLKYIVYSDNGFSFEATPIYHDDNEYYFGKPNVGYDGNVWFYQSFNNGTDNKVYMVTADKQLHQFDIQSGDIIRDIKVGSNGNVYMKVGTSSNTIIKQYKYDNNKLEYVKQYNESGSWAIDEKGNLWFDRDGGIYKLEGDNFVRKYTVQSYMSGLKVYDDNHMALGGLGGSGLTIISNDEVEFNTPNQQQPTIPTPGNQTIPEQTNGQTTTAPQKFTTTLDNDSKLATVNINSSLILKDLVNEIDPTLQENLQSVEVKFDAYAVNGGNGSLKISTNNVIMEFPFSVVDYAGCVTGSYISVNQKVSFEDSILSSIKSIGRSYDFSLATFNQDGTKIKEIHDFKNGKARMSIKISNDDIQNLNKSKLAAFYYNEVTKSWENVGGTFDKNTMIFTFETTHFSKYTIAQIPETILQNGEILPQTGIIFSFNNLLLLAGISLLCGTILLNKRKKLNR